MATKRLRPVHPGDILLHDFIQPLRLSSYKLAKELGVAAPTVNEIVRRRRAVTAEMALRFLTPALDQDQLRVRLYAVEHDL
jgi:addiction module HigA family antidote